MLTIEISKETKRIVIDHIYTNMTEITVFDAADNLLDKIEIQSIHIEEDGLSLELAD